MFIKPPALKSPSIRESIQSNTVQKQKIKCHQLLHPKPQPKQIHEKPHQILNHYINPHQKIHPTSTLQSALSTRISINNLSPGSGHFWAVGR